MVLYGQALVSGILLGGLYGTVAIGLSLTWGMLNVINLAHFPLTFLAAYLTYQITTTTGLDPFLTILITVPLFFLVGVALQWFFEVFDVDEFTSLLITFGLLIIFQSVMRWIWTADHRVIAPELNPYLGRSIWIGSLAFPILHLGAFVAAMLVSGLTLYILHRTYAGKALRAISQDREMAGAFGVNYRRSALLLSGLATAYAAVAGAFIGMIFGVTPAEAVEWLAIIFAVVILGGLANAPGAFGAGIILGVAQTLASVRLGPSWGPLVAFTVLILAVLFKPEGLFSRRART
jgi:branched-chain amino acid transport system permease protein